MQTDKLLTGSVGLCVVSLLLIVAAGSEVDVDGWGNLVMLLDMTAIAIVMLVAFVPWRKLTPGRRLNFATSTSRIKAIKERYAR